MLVIKIKHCHRIAAGAGWIAKVTSSLHDLLPGFKKPCKTKFPESNATIEKPEVNFTNIAQTGIYSYKEVEYC